MNKYDPAKDYYGVLGVSADATREEIEKAYRNEARKRHPDGGGSEEEMKSLNEARDVLTDAETRDAYDAKRRPRRPAYGSSAAFDPEAASRAGTLNIPVSDEDYAGLVIGSATCFAVCLPLLGLVEMQWVFFLWPLRVMAICGIGIGVLMAHAALRAVNRKATKEKPAGAKGRVIVRELLFWAVTLFSAVSLYLLLYAE